MVKMGDESWRQGHLGGDEDTYFPGVRSLAGDPAKRDPVGTADQFVIENAMVDRIGLVPGFLVHDLQCHVFFFQADEVNACGGFKIMPKAKIDGSLVPDINHLAFKRRSLSEHFLGQAFEGVHVMLFLALSCGQATERATAQIQGEEMPGGINLFIDDRFMAGGFVPVAVTGIDVEILQLGERRELIWQTIVEAANQKSIDVMEQMKPPLACERVEIMGKVGTVIQIEAMGLEKSATRCRFVEGALYADGDPGSVGKFRTNPERGAGIDKAQGWVDEIIVNR